MTIKARDELDGIRAAGRAAARVLERVCRCVRPGVSTRKLDERAAEWLAAEGARSAPWLVYGFPGAACISVNEEIVHGVPGERRLAAGDVVKVDVTVEKDGFMADTARTVLVPPSSPQARRLVRCARAAFRRGLAAVRPGCRVSEVGRAVEREVERWGFRVIRDLTGHGIGRTIHEAPTVPNYADPFNPERLADGAVFALEPLISTGSRVSVQRADGWTVATADGSLAAHHEHTLVVRPGRPLVVTAA